MLNNITSKQVHGIAELAKAARHARDELLHGVPDEAIGELHPTKGELGEMGRASFDILSADDPALEALRAAIGGLARAGRSELFAVMRIGQSELAAGDWERVMEEAESLGDEVVVGVLGDDIDLQSHLEKGLYELDLA